MTEVSLPGFLWPLQFLSEREISTAMFASTLHHERSQTCEIVRKLRSKAFCSHEKVRVINKRGIVNLFRNEQSSVSHP